MTTFIHKDDPARSAELFKAAEFPTLINSQGEFMSWDGTAYQPLEIATVQSKVAIFLRGCKCKDAKGKPIPFHPKKAHVAEVVAALEHACHVPANTMAPPVWLDGRPAEYAGLHAANMISLQNGLLDIPSRVLYEQTPSFFTRTALDVIYDAAAPSPSLWLAFLDEVLQGDAELIEMLRQWFGYSLTLDTSMHRVLFLWGRPRSGKGTILRVLTALVGARNIAYPTIGAIGGQFGRQSFIGKSGVQVTDLATNDLTALSNAATTINGISGEDGQTIPRKNISDWTGTLAVRFTLAGNKLPNFRDQTLALASRLLIIPFEVSFAGREDRGLTDRLMAELPGILNWALAGLDALQFDGDFAEPAASRGAKSKLIYRSSPLHGFIEERCSLEPDGVTGKAEFYRAYRDYCAGIGAHAASSIAVGMDLPDLFPAIRAGRLGAKMQRVYRGVRLVVVGVESAEAEASAAADFGFDDLL